MASTELNTLYTSFNDDRDLLNTTQIIQWKGYRQWAKIGGYAGPILPCGHEKCIFVVFCAYNLYSVIMSVSWLHRFLIHDPCFPLQVAVLLMQLTSFMAYIFAFKALHPSTFQIDNFCVKPNRKTTALFIIPLIIVYLSGIATVCDYKGYSEYNGLQSIEYMIFIIGSEIFDGIRYVQLMVVSFIFHQILSSFPTKMISFDLYRLFGSNGTMKSAEIIECENMNHKSFMIPFSRMIAAYRLMVKQFWSFLVVLFVLNVLIWIGLLWNVVWRVDREAPCSTNSVLLDIHFGVEILYFVFMWIVLIWILDTTTDRVQIISLWPHHQIEIGHIPISWSSENGGRAYERFRVKWIQFLFRDIPNGHNIPPNDQWDSLSQNMHLCAVSNEWHWCISTLQINTLTWCELCEDFPKISNILRTSSQVIMMSNSKMFDFMPVHLTMPLTNMYVPLSLDERKIAECIVEVWSAKCKNLWNSAFLHGMGVVWNASKFGRNSRFKHLGTCNGVKC